MTTIWMNHWFTTAVNIIALLREGREDLRIIGTNEHAHSVIRNSCDAWEQEPVLRDSEYTEYCLDFCKRNGVEVFMPRRGLVRISEQRDRFEAQGVKVMADRYEMVSLLNNKVEAYRFFSENGIAQVPDYRLVQTSAEFEQAYRELSGKYAQVCFKFVRDEGGKSFRLIDNERKGYTALFKKQNTRMTYDDAFAALSERETFAPMMVMPFLPGDEVSVDCLNTAQGLIMLPRIKGYEKYEVLRYDAEILDLCRAFQEKAGLECPYNIQFKYLDGVPYFLEVNTRMSGGVHMACCASGVNLPQAALRKLLGEETAWRNDYTEKIVSQVLVPVTIE